MTPCTDTGNAERFVARHGHDFVYCHPMKSWLRWDSKRWSQDKTGQVVPQIIATMRSIYAEAADSDTAEERRKLSAWAITSESGNRIAAAERLARDIHSVDITLLDGAGTKYLLNVNNGTIDLRTGQLRDHDRSDLITKLAPVDFDPAARRPRWDAFVQWLMCGDEDLAATLQQAAGYTLTGDVSERIFFMLYGDGANGKGTFIEMIRDLLGDYYVLTPTHTWLKQRHAGNSATSDLAALKGARFVVANEGEDGDILSTARIKQFVGGGDTITARFLYQEAFSFRPEGKLWYITNCTPEVSATDTALWDRLRVLPFLNRVTDDQRDGHLHDRLMLELSGILNWALAGCSAWQASGLKIAAAERE